MRRTSRRETVLMRYVNLPRSLWNCRGHPLIYTPLKFNLAQYVVSCQETVGTKGSPYWPGKDCRGRQKKGYQSTLEVLPQHRGKMALSGRFCFGSDPNPQKRRSWIREAIWRPQRWISGVYSCGFPTTINIHNLHVSCLTLFFHLW